MHELRKNPSIAFEPFILQPTYDLLMLRQDVIRQETTVMISDDMTDTEEVPYHVLGFRLGNGLFIDLNDNIGIDLLTLMSISRDANYEVIKYSNISLRNGRRYVRKDDRLCTQRIISGDQRRMRCTDLVKKGHRVQQLRNQRVLHTISRKDNTLASLNDRLRIKDQILKINDRNFEEGARRRKRNYQLRGRKVDLPRHIVSISRDKTEIKIWKKRGKRQRLAFTMMKNKDGFFIYNRQGRGMQIVVQEERCVVYRNRNLLYELVKG